MSELLDKAHRHRVSGQYADAESCYRQCLAADPSLAEACWGLGHTLMNEGDFDTCQEFFARAVKLAPANSRFLYDFAMFLTMLGEEQLAKALFQKIVELANDDRLVAEARKQLSYL